MTTLRTRTPNKEPAYSPYQVDPLKPDRIYLCQLCGNVARYPRLQSHTFRFPFGKSWTVDYVFPMVCSYCRIWRQTEASKLSRGRVRFWKRLVALWVGEGYPSMGPRMARAMALRHHILHRIRRDWEYLRHA